MWMFSWLTRALRWTCFSFSFCSICFTTFPGWDYIPLGGVSQLLLGIRVPPPHIHCPAAQSEGETWSLEVREEKEGEPGLWVEACFFLSVPLCSSQTTLNSKSLILQVLMSCPQTSVIYIQDSCLPASIIFGLYYAERVSVSFPTFTVTLQKPLLFVWPWRTLFSTPTSHFPYL